MASAPALRWFWNHCAKFPRHAEHSCSRSLCLGPGEKVPTPPERLQGTLLDGSAELREREVLHVEMKHEDKRQPHRVRARVRCRNWA